MVKTGLALRTALASLGHLSEAYPLPAPAAPPASSLAGQHEQLTCPCLCVCTALPQLNYRGVLSIILLRNPTHSTTPANVKKITNIPAKTRTRCHFFTKAGGWHSRAPTIRREDEPACSPHGAKEERTAFLAGGGGGGGCFLAYCPSLGRAPHEASQRDPTRNSSTPSWQT